MQEYLEAIYRSNHPIVAFSRRHISFVKFLIVGSMNTLIDISLYFVFSSLLNWHPVVANILSTGITLCLSFFLNHKFVFQSSKKKRATAIQFIAVTLFNAWVIQSLIINAIVGELIHTDFASSHMWALNLLAKICGVAVSFVLNFLGYRYVFRTSSKK